MTHFHFLSHFLLVLWISGVDQSGVDQSVLHPSTLQPEGEEEYGQEEAPPPPPDDLLLVLPLENRRWNDYQYPVPHFPPIPRLSVMVPPSHMDPIQQPLRRHYRLEDFLWTGSGDGPHPSEQDGGLAWEDNGGGGGGGTGESSSSGAVDTKHWIRVTKTMTLYRTVLTTIYPVEMTPTVVSGVPVQPTPHFPPGEPHSPTPTLAAIPGDPFSSDYQPVPSENVLWIPTPTFSPTGPPLPTATPPSPPSSSSLGGDDASSGTSSTSTSVQLSSPSPPSAEEGNKFDASSMDPVYWIQTSIKANNSAFRDTPHVFQTAMQKSLARVYASAFKRHLLATLGVLPPQSSKSNQRRRRRRKRRWSYHGDDNDKDLLDSQDEDEKEEGLGQLDQWLYVAQSSMSATQLKHLATATMNVTVRIVNVTAAEQPKVDLRYVVLAEGTPVPAFSAVKELELVSKMEMEQELGYEIINKKAEALVAGPPEQMTRNSQYVATSPWLIVALTTICLLVILVGLIGFMVWKWKHNRLGDSSNRGMGSSSLPARPQSGTIEIQEGVINPAFLGTPSRTGRGETLDQSPKSSPGSSLLSAARARTAKKISDVLSRRTTSSSRSRVKSRTKGKDGKEEDGGDMIEAEDSSKRDKLLAAHQNKTEHNSPTSSEDLRLHKRKPGMAVLTSSEGSADWKELLGEPRPRMSGGTARKRSPVRGGRSAGKTSAGGVSSSAISRDPKKDLLRKRRKKSKVEEANLKTDEDGEEDDEEEENDDDDEGTEFLGLGQDTPPPKQQKQQQQPWARGLSDAISLGNLDIFQDSIAQTPSEYAKKLVPWRRPGSAVSAAGSATGKQSQPYFLPSSGLTSGGGGSSTRPGSRLAPPAQQQQTIEEIPSFDLTEEEDGGGGGSREQDRDLSEKSFELRDSPPCRKSPTAATAASSPGVDTKEAGVQTPTRISKTASHKQRAAAKPRKSWRGSPGAGGGESVISTESEEIVEVHHINTGMPEDQNPLGRMRKRFHQFLDDAFNVMVSGGTSSSAGAEGGGGAVAGARLGTSSADPPRPTQSAKVSISHEVVETETEWRPWTSHVIREETLQKLRRPKSAAVPIGPPKRAWTASSERQQQQQRTQSAKSQSHPKAAGGGSQSSSRMGSAVDIQGGPSALLIRKHTLPPEEEEDEESYDKTSTAIQDSSTKQQSSSSDFPQSRSQSVVLSPAFIFPQYPAYPDIRVASLLGGGGAQSSTTSGSSSLSQPPSSLAAPPPPPPLPPPKLPSNDPAVPLIQAIKDEMKRFEKPGPSSSNS